MSGDAVLDGERRVEPSHPATRASGVTPVACSTATRPDHAAGARSRSARAPSVAADRAPSSGHRVAVALKLNFAGATRLKRPGALRACSHAGGTGSGRTRLARGTTSLGTTSGQSASTALADVPSRAAPSRAPAAVAVARHRPAAYAEAEGQSKRIRGRRGRMSRGYSNSRTSVNRASTAALSAEILRNLMSVDLRCSAAPPVNAVPRTDAAETQPRPTAR